MIVKQCIKVYRILSPENVRLFENVSLQWRIVSDQIKGLANDIPVSLKQTASEFVFYSRDHVLETSIALW